MDWALLFTLYLWGLPFAGSLALAIQIYHNNMLSGRWLDFHDGLIIAGLTTTFWPAWGLISFWVWVIHAIDTHSKTKHR